MKPNDYIKKYKLRETIHFDHADFVQDMTIDFMSSIEYYKAATSEFLYKHFEKAVEDIETKWEAISNKMIGEGLPEKLWNYFNSAVVHKMRDEIFPEIREREGMFLNMSTQELQEYLRECAPKGVFISTFGTYRLEKDLERVIETNPNNPSIVFVCNLFYNRMMKKEAERERKEKEAHKRWREQWEKQREQHRNFWERFSEDFFGSFFGGILKSCLIPTTSFQVLSLTETATLEDVKTSYRKLSMLHHPDKGGSQEKFIEITEAKNKCLIYLQNKSK